MEWGVAIAILHVRRDALGQKIADRLNLSLLRRVQEALLTLSSDHEVGVLAFGLEHPIGGTRGCVCKEQSDGCGSSEESRRSHGLRNV
jgi:hypothetical protein